MPTIRIPSGTATGPAQAFTPHLLEKALDEACLSAPDFTGYITVESGDCLHLLFIFRSHPYAAGKTIGDRPSPLTIREFFHEMALLDDPAATISVHACDPVLLKSLLIFLQCDPTAKAPAELMNLEAVLHQIRQDSADALVILENRQMLNQFFFKGSNKGISYFSDTEFHGAEGMPFHEQLLAYTSQPDATINALIYRDTATHEAADAQLVTMEELKELLRGEKATEPPPVEERPVPETAVVAGDMELEILNGPQKGQKLSGPLPGTIGSMEADIVINDPQVSELHAAIREVDGTLMLVDLNSTSGTALNGLNILQQAVSEGDVIGVGATALRVVRLTPP